MSVYEERIMKMISFAGAGRTKLVEAMRKAAAGNYDEAYQLIDASDEDILKCHKEQTKKRETGSSLRRQKTNFRLN